MAEVDLLRHYPRDRRKLAAPRSKDPANRAAALKFGEEYFDGRREQGYGGYRYDGRWVPIARDIVAHFGLRAGHHVLDVGCAKGFLVKDLMLVCPGLRVYGLDISEYALRSAEPEARGRLVRGTADQLPFRAGAFEAGAFCLPAKNVAGRESIKVAPPDCSIFCTSAASAINDLFSVAVNILGDGLLGPVSTTFCSATQAA